MYLCQRSTGVWMYSLILSSSNQQCFTVIRTSRYYELQFLGYLQDTSWCFEWHVHAASADVFARRLWFIYICIWILSPSVSFLFLLVIRRFTYATIKGLDRMAPWPNYLLPTQLVKCTSFEKHALWRPVFNWQHNCYATQLFSLHNLNWNKSYLDR